MSAEQVAEGIVRATEAPLERRSTLRLFDRLMLLASTFAPRLIGRQALKRYKTN